MASLTHVCMWSDKGWKRITAAEAARIHPGGRVSAHSGLFMCELCGQYVLLTDGNVQVRHFRHSSAEKSKDCPERTFGPGAVITYSAVEHELPIRICNMKNGGFDLEMGLIQVPSKLLSSQLKIEIKSGANRARSLVYSKERINPKGITYLFIGNLPCEKYYLRISGISEDIYQFWPKIVTGIDPAGTIFDASTGKKLVYDSDVVVGKKYYLLKRGIVFAFRGSRITIREVLRKQVSWESWGLYEVIANDFNEDAARFFLDYHYRLTENPVSIQTVWPVSIENPYVIKHNHNSVVLHVMGYAPTTQSFPSADIKRFSTNHGAVLDVSSKSRQQLISAGRTKALQYTYFWREPLNQVTKKPKAVVTDLNDVEFFEAEYNHLPDKGILRFFVPYDGLLCISEKGRLVNKRTLPANTTIELDGIGWNMEIDVLVGLDIVWKAAFVKKQEEHKNDEEEKLLSRLQSYRGTMIPIPYSLGSVSVNLARYPQIQKWLYKCIRLGYINERAYRDLQSLIITEKTKGLMYEGRKND